MFPAQYTGSPPIHTDSSLNHISLEYSYAELHRATRNFGASQKVGAGSYGGVFRGELEDGTQVAVKVLELPDEAGFEEEVKVLSKFRHPNLVILMGFARNEKERLLVYEMLAGGDLHKRLQRSCMENVAFLWKDRVSIALDAACGLSHLHHSSPKVFHRDIKSPNILLDKNGTAKMADFGLACLTTARSHRVKQASGTVGYACPLYVQRGVVTEGSEVYSFGMVLLELLTASPPAVMGPKGSNPKQIQYLATYINGELSRVLSLLDGKAQFPPAAAQAIAELALSCICMQEEQRPNFVHILRTLRGIHMGALSGEAAVAPPVQQLGEIPGRGKAPLLAQCPAHRPGAQGGVRSMTPPVGQKGQRFASPLRVAGNPRPPSPQRAPGALAQRVVLTPSTDASPRKNLPLRPFLRPQEIQVPRKVSGPIIVVDQQPASPMSPMRTAQRQQSPFAVQRRQRDASPFSPSRGQHEPMSPFSPSRTGPRSHPPLLPQASQPPQQQQHPEPGSPAQVQFRRVGEDLGDGLEKQRDAPPPGSFLFSLRCVFTECDCLENVPPEERLVEHRADFDASHPVFVPFTIGRTCQPALFDALVKDAGSRSTISRDHFQISVEPAPIALRLTGGGLPCTFSVKNLSRNGTHVNGEQLGRGEHCVLRHGDIITLSKVPADGTQVRIIQFIFDLTGSCLRELDLSQGNTQTLPCVAAGMDEKLDEEEDESEDDVPPAVGNTQVGSAISENTVFWLEACGPGVHEELPARARCIAFAPPDPGRQLYSSLVLGRAHQLDFWQEVLRFEAFNTLSRQHLEVQTWRAAGDRFSFLVRSLSDVSPIRVRIAGVHTADLTRGEQQQLTHGDEIVMNFDTACTFWLVFHNLKAGAPESLAPTDDAKDQQSRSSIVDDGVACFQARHTPAVLRPPINLNLKDDAEISTTATPQDDYQQEEADEGEMDLVAGCASFLPHARTASGNLQGLPRDVRSRDGRGVRVGSMSPGKSDLGAPPNRSPVSRRDSRGVREDNPRELAPPRLPGWRNTPPHCQSQHIAEFAPCSSGSAQILDDRGASC